MSWIETASETFVARHHIDDSDSVEAALVGLEAERSKLDAEFDARPSRPVSVVFHTSTPMLYAAQPHLLVMTALCDPTGRRYLAGSFGNDEIHVLSPRRLAERAGGLGSAEALALTAAKEYAAMLVGLRNPSLPPPFRPKAALRTLTWAWLGQGAAQHLSGQVRYLRAALRQRMRGAPPRFPPSLRDTAVLGGTLFDLLERRRGREAVIELCTSRPRGDARHLAAKALGWDAETAERAWLEHLNRLCRPEPEPIGVHGSEG